LPKAANDNDTGISPRIAYLDVTATRP